MKIFYTGIAFLCSFHFCLSQNLVPNPGFEQFFSCPQSINTNKTNTKIAPYWNSPSYGTPDLYNKCSKYQMGIQNATGFTNPFSGDGFAGIITWEGKKGYREYLQVELNEPLKAGHVYSVSFYYKLSSYSKYSADRIGFYMSNTDAFYKQDTPIPVRSSFTKIKEKPMDIATGSWEHFAVEYIAKGGERYLTIGNFDDNKITQTFHLSFVTSQEPMLEQAAYYYLDEVSVIEKPKVFENSIAITEEEVKQTKSFVLKKVSFDHDSDSLLRGSFEELNKILQLLNAQPSWKIILIGHTDNVGAAEYNQLLSERRANAIRDFLVSNGIEQNRIQTKGYGSSRPLVDEKNDSDRRQNRRVEFKLVTSLE